MSKSLYWFRSDLRISDNLALLDAIQDSDFLIAVFIITPKTWASHSLSKHKLGFLQENLKFLSKSLIDIGIPLLIKTTPSFSNCPLEINKICSEFNIDSIYLNNEYALDECNRDEAVIKSLPSNIQIYKYDQHLILPPGTVLSKSGTPFKVFTAFKNTWLKIAHNKGAWRSCTSIKSNIKNLDNTGIKPDKIPNIVSNLLHIESQWPAGEKKAYDKLIKFCEEKISSYKKTRDFPDIAGTSQLSSYLSLGILSPRQCVTEALKLNKINHLDCIDINEGVAIWISELVWREFYNHIIYFYPEICRNKAMKPNTENIPWSDDINLFNAWKDGKTGFPIVDAGMRQLNQTGWMHNRLRMITAMFLTKILLIDWRLGEKYFMSKLIDGDFAANNGGWQWCASTGTDSVPYFRIFNPTTQSTRFDQSGDFIRLFCPELAHLEDKHIHEPYKYIEKYGKINYPKPIVDYKSNRAKTLKLFKELK